MKQKTSLASGIDITKDMAEFDASCKRLLSEKIILAWIMKSCLDEFRDFDVETIAEKCIEGNPIISKMPVSPGETGSVIQGMAQELTSPTEGSITFDIYFNAIVPSTRVPVQLIINIETQANFYPRYPLLKRGVFYCGRMLSAQQGTVFTKSHYEKLRKVYSIWLCTNPPKRRANTINRYRLSEEQIIGNKREKPKNYDLLSIVLVCLGNAGQGNCNGILKLLGVLLSKETTPATKKHILQNEYHIPMTQNIEREVNYMGSISQGWVASTLKEGIKQGIKQGTESTLLTALKNLMASMNWTVEEAMNALRIPEADRANLVSKLTQQSTN